VCVRRATSVADEARVSALRQRAHDVVRLVREANTGKALESNMCNTGPDMCDKKQQMGLAFFSERIHCTGFDAFYNGLELTMINTWIVGISRIGFAAPSLLSCCPRALDTRSRQAAHDLPNA
jgi:hypothetical protein